MLAGFATIFALALISLILFYELTMSEKFELLGKVNWHGPAEKKQVALTFDDGPNEPFTSSLLDLLDKHGVKASFFVVGSNLVKTPGVTKRAFEAGHTIGNHSYSHSFGKYFEQPSFEGEIVKNNQAIEGVIGKMPALYRSPWLFRHPLLLKTAKRLGMTPVFGIFGSEKELLQLSATQIANRAFQRVRNGSIIIFHDGYNAKGAERGQTVAAIDILIPKLRAANFDIVTVDQLLGIKPYQ